jgi:hypothetical protein
VRCASRVLWELGSQRRCSRRPRRRPSVRRSTASRIVQEAETLGQRSDGGGANSTCRSGANSDCRTQLQTGSLSRHGALRDTSGRRSAARRRAEPEVGSPRPRQPGVGRVRTERVDVDARLELWQPRSVTRRVPLTGASVASVNSRTVAVAFDLAMLRRFTVAHFRSPRRRPPLAPRRRPLGLRRPPPSVPPSVPSAGPTIDTDVVSSARGGRDSWRPRGRSRRPILLPRSIAATWRRPPPAAA